MRSDRIDFISDYCDRWCERCAFTERCSAFAANAAIGMCGDVADGLELALGTAQPAGDAEPPPRPDWRDELDDAAIPDETSDAWVLAEERRRHDVRESSIGRLADACALVGYRWLSARADPSKAPADAALAEAIEIAARDAVLVPMKLHRALNARLRHEDEEGEDHPVQNDGNGSAKVALISLERSELAWRVIAQATGDDTPAVLADELRDLRQEVEDAFPDAWSFVRPGFDEPDR